MITAGPEEVQDLYDVGVVWPEPVWFGGVELRYLAGVQGVLVVSDDEPQCSGQDVEPFVTIVGDQPWLTGAEYLFEDLHSAGVRRQRNDNAPTVVAMGFQVDAGITGRRCSDELVQRDTVGARERDEQIERWVSFTGLEA